MNAREAYNQIIADIEEGAGNPYISADEVKDDVLKAWGIGLRDLNSLIQFMTGDTLLGYIKNRKMMVAYKSLITSAKFNVRLAEEISGLDSHSSFDKKFKHVFHMSPTDAYNKKDKSLYVGPSDWENVSNQSDRHVEKDRDVFSDASQTKYGVSKDVYEKMIEAYELESLYALPPLFCEHAFSMHQQTEIPLRDTFRFMDSIYDFLKDDPLDESRERSIEDNDWSATVLRISGDPYVQFIFFECDLSVQTAYYLEDKIGLPEKEIVKLPPILIQEFAFAGDMDFDFFYRAHQYYFQHANKLYGEEDYEDFVENLCKGYPIEEAFEEIIPSGIDDYCDDYDPEAERFMDEMYDSFEKMAEEIAAWNYVRIDEEYDEQDQYWE